MYNALIVDDEPRTRQALIESVDWKKCNVRHVYEASNISEAEMPNTSRLRFIMRTICVSCVLTPLFRKAK